MRKNEAGSERVQSGFRPGSERMSAFGSGKVRQKEAGSKRVPSGFQVPSKLSPGGMGRGADWVPGGGGGAEGAGKDGKGSKASGFKSG